MIGGIGRIRATMAVNAAKGTALASRTLGRGGGTAIPGHVADRIDPNLITRFSAQLGRGAVVVAGTNGKTTTSKMIADVLEADGAKVVHNRSGSNLIQGIAATCAQFSSPSGRSLGDAAVFEADEAAFPEIVRRVRPAVVLLNNLYRDQLDRYGELKTIMNKWRPALEALPASSTVVVNVDDPALAGLTTGLAATVVPIGMTGLDERLESLPHAADSIVCPACAAALEYDALYLSHLGEWRCPACGVARPTPLVEGRNLELRGDGGLAIDVSADAGKTRFETGMPGIYNAYNLLAAVAVGRVLGVTSEVAKPAIERFQSAFGRIERLTWLDRALTIALVKNPVGFNEVLRMLTHGGSLASPVLIVINDLDADGRDVSWLWDVDFELLANDGPAIATAGIRGTDMANRLKYAGIAADRIVPLDGDYGDVLIQFVERVPAGTAAWILPTYTAMLGLRKELVRRGAVDDYWKPREQSS